jgi:hypothetical protein
VLNAIMREWHKGCVTNIINNNCGSILVKAMQLFTVRTELIGQLGGGGYWYPCLARQVGQCGVGLVYLPICRQRKMV